MAPPAAKDGGFAKLPVGAKLGLLVMLLLVISALYYFALHMTLTEDIESAQSRHVQLQNELTEAQQRQQEYLACTQELAQREAIDRQNKRILPERAEIAAFLQDLNRLSELSGLQMQLVEPRPEEAQEYYVRIPVNLKLKGRYHQLAKFFYNVSRLERAINMENVRLTEPVVAGEEVTLSVDVLATTFRRPSEADLAAQQAPGTPGAAPGGS